jgi:hypothetical protein
LSAIFPLIAAHRNEFGRTSLVGSQPFGLLASRGRNSWLCFIQAHLCLRRLSRLAPLLSAGVGDACSWAMSDKISANICRGTGT